MSVIKVRERLGARMRGEESGFTLVELLVVMLILGLLAAIAIPAFFNQRDKARDADAKASVRTAQTAIETYATDNGGSYAGATAGDLVAIEPTLTNANFGEDETGATTGVTSSEEGYSVSVTSDTDNVFTIARSDGTGTDAPAAGTVTLACTTVGEAGCPEDGNWGG